MKTIGVIGGLGPQATMDFEARVHRVAQRRIPQRLNSGYPPMIVYYHRSPPFVVGDDGLPRIPIHPDPGLLEACRRIGALADFLVIPSNAPHLIQADIERASGRKVLSMVDATLDEVRRRHWRKVGVIGLGEPTVYTGRLDARGTAHEILDPAARKELDAAIFRVMEGREDAGSREAARGAVAAMRGRRVDGVILGCSEIPLLLGDGAVGPDLLNPAELLAEAAVARAIE
jgi:aspartate racemase